MGFKQLPDPGGEEIPPIHKIHTESSEIPRGKLFKAETQSVAENWRAEQIQKDLEAGKEIKYQTEQLSNVTHTYGQFAERLGMLAKGRPQQSWEITLWEHDRLVSALQDLPESGSKQKLRDELEGGREVTAQWLAEACGLIRQGLSEIQTVAGKALWRSQHISFEVEPRTRAEQAEGFRRLDVERWKVEQVLANQVEPALSQDHVIGLIDAAGKFVLDDLIEDAIKEAMTELFGQAIDLGASGGLITLVRLGFELIAEPEPSRHERKRKEL